MGTSYNADVIAWANEQAAMLRAGRLSDLDIEHLAEEIEDVGKSEQRELRSRMAVLLAHLLKWEYQPERRGASWEATIHAQRIGIKTAIRDTPSLKHALSNPEWWLVAWGDALSDAYRETGIDHHIFPEDCPWSEDQIADPDFFPGAADTTHPVIK